MVIQWYIIIILLIICNCNCNYLKSHFENNFNTKCSKFPFIEKYQSMLSNPTDRYTIFVFHERGTDNGGLGDRLAGMLTAFAYSLRYNRNFVMESEKSFIDYFQPYNNLNITWSSRKWSNWDKLKVKNIRDMNCVNPRPNKMYCAFDYDMPDKIIRIKSNRAYLCRWTVIESLKLNNHLLKELGFNDNTSIFDIAGCLLKLIMWPTDLLWNDVKEIFNSDITIANIINPMILGFHFRCGDSSFINSKIQSANPSCVYLSKELWKGTRFSDDTSYDSPIDFGNCGRYIINQYNNSNIITYIASDNEASYQQINETLQYKYTIKPTKACHMSIQQHCTSLTLLHWFTLSISDIIITQALQITDFKSGYHDEILYPNGSIIPYELGPISAFSRYAIIYGLSMDNLRYGSECKQINSNKLSRQTQGNWVCNPRQFF